MTPRRFPAWVDGRLLPPGTPAVGADAAGLLLGLGVFETLRLEGTRVLFQAEHVERLGHGARVLGLDLAPGLAERALAEYVAALRGEQRESAPVLALRLTLLAGGPGAPPLLLVGAREPEPVPAAGVECILEPRALLRGDPLGALKTIARPRHVLARRRAREVGAFDALLGTDGGDVLEASAANVFARVDGRYWTPELAGGCLPGITRGRLLSALRERGEPVHEAPLWPADLARADEIFLTSSVAGVVPLIGVRDLVAGLPGPEGAGARLAAQLTGIAQA